VRLSAAHWDTRGASYFGFLPIVDELRLARLCVIRTIFLIWQAEEDLFAVSVNVLADPSTRHHQTGVNKAPWSLELLISSQCHARPLLIRPTVATVLWTHGLSVRADCVLDPKRRERLRIFRIAQPLE
jgi:hypothetical protein